MFDAPTPDPTSDAPAETRAERRMRRLEAMAEMGVGVARRLERQAELASAHAETDLVPDNLPHQQRLNDIARAFAQVGRAVAVLTALEDRIDRGLPAVPDLDRDRPLREQAARERRGQVRHALVCALQDRPALGPRRLIRLTADLERLLDAELRDLDRFLARPLAETIARLGRDLGLAPLGGEAELWADPAPAGPGPDAGPNPSLDPTPDLAPARALRPARPAASAPGAGPVRRPPPLGRPPVRPAAGASPPRPPP